MTFPDLRIHRAGMREEGFWPSFTDIMMVIVMIFLMAMLGLLLRNMDLVARLQQALSEAQQASQRVTQTAHANRDLSARLAQSEHDLEMLRAQLMDSDQQRQLLAQQLRQSDAQAKSWRQKHEALSRAHAEERARIVTLRQQLEQFRQQSVQQAARAAEAERRLQQQGLDLDRLREDLARQQSLVRQARDDYGMLEAKYRRLLRPARSSIGKVVVTVRYHKEQGALRIELQPPGAEAFHAVDSVALHQELSALKERLGNKLYVRILFPEESGLSYNEAWRITGSLLRMYDYYYQQPDRDPAATK